MLQLQQGRFCDSFGGLSAATAKGCCGAGSRQQRRATDVDLHIHSMTVSHFTPSSNSQVLQYYDDEECAFYADVFPDPSTHPTTISIFSLLYAIIFVVGLIGNLSVIVATMKYRSLQSVQNIFILNLAASDVILCLLSIPLTPVTLIVKQWYFGAVLCRTVALIQAIGMFIGTFSLCAIAVDRYFRLVIAPGRPMRRSQAVRVTWLIWMFALLVTLPYVFHMSLKRYPGICGEFCTEEWPDESSKRVYTFFILLVQFVIPFAVMTFCYHSVFAFLSRRAHSRLSSIAQQANMLYVLAATAGADSQHHRDQLSHLIEQKKRVAQQRRRVTIILVSMVAIFGFTALPHNIVSIIYEYDSDYTLMRIADSDISYLVNLFAHWLAKSFSWSAKRSITPV
uniref:G_PROTEIN_RECEP_F1_2 domain-containing protein n=1 Tax=Ascaris lumbricoides TaxID=6252 RepID=A0A0M3HXG7_ASCLU